MKKKLLRLIKMCSYYTISGLLAQVIFINLIFASDLSAQKAKSIEEVYIAIQLDNAKLEEAFDEIESKSGYRFAYEKKDLDKKVRISLNMQNSTLRDVLMEISKEASLYFRQVNHDIDVRRIERNINSENPRRVEIFQARKVTGQVTTSEDNSGLPGVNVIVKGTNTGTVTDVNGNYSIDVPSENTMLVFSSIGYILEEVQVGDKSVINVTLQTDIQELSEIVVVGYGQQKKRDVTGSMVSIDEESFNKGVIASPEQLIQGRTPGVQVTSSSGEPGGGINIRIRGTSSIRSGNNPLFVVDGVPLGGDDISGGGEDVSFGSSSARNPLNFINPNDIASIDILKDASATAIYGSRGANGVVIITTKSGRGKSQLEYSGSFGVSTIANKYDLLDADTYLSAAAELGADASTLDMGSETDWQDEIFRTALTQSHNFSFGGGSQDGDFRVSLSYFDQEGIVEQSGLERVTARFNGTHNFINDRLILKTQLTVADITDKSVPITDNSGFEGDLLGAMISANPTRPVRNPDGTFNQPGTDQLNPVAMLAYNKDNTNTLKFLGNVSFDLKITDDLTFTTNLGLDKSESSRKAAFSADLVARGIQPQDYDGDGTIDNLGGRANFIDISSDSRLMENYFTYDKVLGGNSKINVVLGYSYQRFENESRTIEAQNFRTTDLDLMLNNLGSVGLFDQADPDVRNRIPIIGNSSKTIDELQSYFGRINYSLYDKYLFTATLRADGSTKFGGNNKYGYFPSFAAAWRLADEAFIPDFFTDLKLRAGYGVTGNQEIPNNLFQARQRYFHPDGQFGFEAGGNLDAGLPQLQNVAFNNPDLKWESTAQINFGIDYGFANNRIRGSIDFYHKTTNNLLVKFRSAQPAPNEFAWLNLDANVINKGVDFAFNAILVDQDDFDWDLLFNVGYNENKVENLGTVINTGRIHGQGLSEAFAQRIADGQPLYAYYLRKFVGFDDEGQSIYEDGDFQQFTGDSPLPKVTTGFTNNIRYRNFNASIFFDGQFGHKVYNNTKNAYFTAGALGNGRNVSTDVPGSGESNLNSPDVSTRFLEDASFVRLQNVTLGYNINVGNDSFIQSLRVSLIGQNLFVITEYSGLDPEVNVNKALDGVPSFGIDYTSYPRSRTFSLGVNAKF